MLNNNILPTLPATPQYSIAKDRAHRQIRLPQKYGEADLVAYTLNVAEEINSTEKFVTYIEAISCSDSSKWLIAMQEEMESLNKNYT